MNRRYYWDNERGLTTIRRSPAARQYPTVDEVKEWMATGIAPDVDEEPERCNTCGRAFDCICPNCEYCGVNGTPHFQRRVDPIPPTGTEP